MCMGGRSLSTIIDDATTSLKQKNILHAFVNENDIFVCLSTGYGKSLFFFLLTSKPHTLPRCSEKRTKCK